jgi:hypothetical protein
LAKFLIPFGEQNFPSGYRLVQDNDPKHTSKSTKKFLNKRKINLWETPAQSPVRNRPLKDDIFIIYLIKGSESNRTCLGVRKVAKPRTIQELKEAILAFWTTKLTNQLCNKYIDHVYKVIPAVIKKKGQASGY